jgi:predicted RNA-binding protein with RPS1 domain
LKQLTADPWASVHDTYEVGQVRTGRVTRVVEFGAFVELEPGVEALAHASTFAPTGRSRDWSREVAPGTTAAFEILSIDADKKRIGVAFVPEGSARASATARSPSAIVEDEQSTEHVGGDSERENPALAKGFGSLAEKLRGALERREK